MKFRLSATLIILLSLLTSSALAAPGDLLWESYYDRNGNSGGGDTAQTIAVRKSRVFVGGVTTDNTDADFSVRAYSAADGALIWEDHFDPEDVQFESVRKVAVHKNRVVAVGETFNSAGRRDWTVRVYKTSDGTVMWTDIHNVGGDEWDSAFDVAIQGNRVFVVGHTQAASGSTAWTVRAYRLSDGTLLWQDNYNREVSGENRGRVVAVQGKRVFVGGFTETVTGGYAWTVRCYRAKNGALLWQDNFDREADGSEDVFGLTVAGNRLFVVGESETAATDGDMTIRVYRTHNGALRWQKHVDGGISGSDEATAVAVKSGRVFVSGFLESATNEEQFAVWAYRTRNGNLLWSDEHDEEAGSFYDEASDIKTVGRKVCAVGRTDSTAGDYAFAVRCYKAKDGMLAWANNYNREGTERDFANAIAVQGRTIYVAGETGTALGGKALSVRVFRR